MISSRTVRNIVGIIGNVISFGLFLSPVYTEHQCANKVSAIWKGLFPTISFRPLTYFSYQFSFLPTFYRIIKNKSVEEFQPYPYIATLMNCMLWVFYGLPVVHPDSILVTTINGIGLGIEIIYLTIFFIYDGEKKKARKQICTWIPIELVATTIIVIITLTALRSTTAKIAFVGVIADVFNVIMYASPTLAVKKVIETKSVQYMPFWLSFAGFINAIVWTAYSLIHKIDLYILISNGIGSLWGLTQLIIYAIYCKSTPKSEESDKKQQQQQEIQLSEV